MKSPFTSKPFCPYTSTVKLISNPLSLSLIATAISYKLFNFLVSKDPVLQNQVDAIISTIKSWAFASSKTIKAKSSDFDECAVIIATPGGEETLQVVEIPKGYTTMGYNIKRNAIFIPIDFKFDRPTVVIKVSHFSVNFADICIRFGLYESSIRNVGWPIVPGFDVSGEVVAINGEHDSDIKIGDKVFGASLFGTYSTLLTIPLEQIRKLPHKLTLKQAAALPAVALTALHALKLSGISPMEANGCVLIHSAAGGVGSMLVQMAKLCGAKKVVGVVGRNNKVDFLKSLACDVVITKENKTDKQWWKEVEDASPEGYRAVFDANGVSTLKASYDHLCMCGRLIVYGFHSNMPMGRSTLSPVSWLSMLVGMIRMPRFDAMFMTLESKGVIGFNLSFFENEREIISSYMDQIVAWVDAGLLAVAEVSEFDMDGIGNAHALIQSGKSVGKICVKCRED